MHERKEDTAMDSVHGHTWPPMAQVLLLRSALCRMWRARPLAVGNAVSNRTSTPSTAATCKRALPWSQWKVRCTYSAHRAGAS